MNQLTNKINLRSENTVEKGFKAHSLAALISVIFSIAGFVVPPIMALFLAVTAIICGIVGLYCAIGAGKMEERFVLFSILGCLIGIGIALFKGVTLLA